MNKLKVAAVAGGFSSEREVSLKSVGNILSNLDNERFEGYLIIIDSAGWRLKDDSGEYQVDKNNFTVPQLKLSFDFSFIMIHGTPGEDGKLQGYFDMIGMPYSTCNQFISTLTFNKWGTNQLVKNLGVRVADSVLIAPNVKYDKEGIINQLGLPLFVKPNDSGSSFGVSRVDSEDQFDEAVKYALSEGTSALAEAFMDGKEVCCGAFFNGSDYIVLPITEIRTTHVFFDYAAKYEGASEEITPAEIEDHYTQEIQTTVYNLCKILKLKGIIRIDFIITKDGPKMIEINTVPGFTNESLVPQQIRAMRLEIRDVITQVIHASLQS